MMLWSNEYGFEGQRIVEKSKPQRTEGIPIYLSLDGSTRATLRVSYASKETL